MPLERVIADATAALREATSVAGACRAALEVIGRHTNAYGAVLIRVHDRLRCVAATGSWHVYSAVQPDAGVVGRVYSTGRSEVVTNVAVDPDYISLGPLAEVEVCVPVVGEGVSIGAINLEWPNSVDTDEWRSAGEEIGRQLGAHVNWLGGPPRESRSEKLLRHAVALGTAANEDDLVTDSLIAAADVSGLHTQVIVLTQPDGLEIHIDQNAPTELAHRIAALGEDVLIPFIERAGRYGASYSHGDPDELDATGFGALTALGVRTLIAVPLGVRRDTNTIRGVLLAADETLSRPDASLVNLLELLAAQAWSSLERLQMLENLHERARSDPLTGLRHHGSFSERLAHAQPGCTAVFTIDIDGFKNINDTYGHQTGDRVLVDLSKALTGALRTQDDLYRIGGDEFAAVVDVARTDEALRVADRLVSAARVIGHTISIGVAIQGEEESPLETLSRADNAMYVAKREGRDGVRLAA